MNMYFIEGQVMLMLIKCIYGCLSRVSFLKLRYRSEPVGPDGGISAMVENMKARCECLTTRKVEPFEVILLCIFLVYLVGWMSLLFNPSTSRP